MLFLQTALVGAALALSAALLLAIRRDTALPGLARAALMATLACGALHVLLLGKAGFGWSEPARTLLRLGAAPGAWCLWIAVRLAFDDTYRPTRRDLLPLAALLLAALPWPGRPAGAWPMIAVAGALAAHMLWCLMAGRAVDLDEQRRHWRDWIAATGALYLVAMTAGRLLRPAGLPIEAFDTAGLALLVGIKLAILHRWPAHPAFGTPDVTPHAPPAPPAPPAAEARAVAPPDPAQAQALLARVRDERWYADHTLTLAALAARAGLPEYRARQLIHQGLGYRNFNLFINDLRLVEIEARLRDPAQAHLPILSIALDAGFGSIGPFNRAFKARHAITPGEFRRTPGGTADAP